MMSDGAKRVFMILTKIIVSSVSNVSLIAIEEPENSVHPGLFKAYMQSLGAPSLLALMVKSASLE